ncbi:DUF222 domain-containing protein [Gordonia sp. PKS22-38]|uniref:DUF222 domain-containing protein n=1 Tax=Gordonia prachuapensis TaxID=3115651 RepID=A0ABU7MZ75_9ACTN|nr:DUF222 domain-containing protein [Gordonia sp. PKS22-38]
MVDHQLAAHVRAMERLGVAKRSGGTTRQLLIEMGLAPSVVVRLLRIAGSLDASPKLAKHAADGAISAEHVDSVAKGMAHIQRRSPVALPDDERTAHEVDLLAQVFSGATPAEVAAHARSKGNQVADETGGLPASEDRGLNVVDWRQDDDGRLEVRGSLDSVVGEKLVALLQSLSIKRPEPDGSPDPRSAGRRRADALDQVLDAAVGGDTHLTGAPRHLVMVTIPADAPDLAALPWLGPVSEATVRMLACDTTVSEVVIDGERVPLHMGHDKRLFTHHQRRAIGVRDECCVKCGAPAGWSHVHHLVHWVDGGLTDLDNGCLLCSTCHAEVHARGWEVVMGRDRHPRLIPPADIDPTRTPRPAYNRRNLNVDGLPAAA